MDVDRLATLAKIREQREREAQDILAQSVASSSTTNENDLVDDNNKYSSSKNKSSYGMSRVVILSVVAALATVTFWYFLKNYKPLKVEDFASASIHVFADPELVYDYLLTPMHRTDWHLDCAEVNGPGSDHAAYPGEMFSEDFSLVDEAMNVDWTMTALSINSLVSLDGQNKNCKQCHWKEVFALKQHKSIPGIGVRVEFYAFHKLQNRTDFNIWKKKAATELKSSLSILKERLEQIHRTQKDATKNKQK